jgi:hypothetical protein
MFTSETFKIISFSDIIDLVGDVDDIDISFGDADFTLVNLVTFMYLLERQKTFEECGKVWESVKETLKITGDLMPYDVEDIYVNLES